jgi:hypothetical protein
MSNALPDAISTQVDSDIIEFQSKIDEQVLTELPVVVDELRNKFIEKVSTDLSVIVTNEYLQFVSATNHDAAPDLILPSIHLETELNIKCVENLSTDLPVVDVRVLLTLPRSSKLSISSEDVQKAMKVLEMKEHEYLDTISGYIPNISACFSGEVHKIWNPDVVDDTKLMIVWHLDGQEEFYFESLYEKAFDDNYYARPSDSRFVSFAPHALYCFYCGFIFH